MARVRCENARGDRCGHGAAVFAALHHHRDRILRVDRRARSRQTRRSCPSCLRSSPAPCRSCPRPARSASRALPPVPPSSLTTFQRPRRTISICSRREIESQIARALSAPRNRPGCPSSSRTGLPSALDDTFDQPRIIGDAAIRDRRVNHRQLQRRDEIVSLADGNIGGVGRGPASRADNESASTPAPAGRRAVHP